MSKIKIEKAYAKNRITSFGGIREEFSQKGDSASDMRNFRISADGSLEKRNGWRLWHVFSNPPRGYWEGTLEDTFYSIAISGSHIYQIYDNQTPSLIGILNSSAGRVSFLRYRERLYLLDGQSLLVFNPARRSFTSARGYVPLYGRNWHPTQMGDTNEPLNLLNQNLRIHYLNTTGVTTFTLPFFAASLNSVRVNNRKTTAYSFSAGSDSFTLSSASAGDVVEVAMTISGTDALQQQLNGVTEGCLHREGNRERLLLYGAPQGYRVFCSSEVSNSMLSACSVFYSDCDPLYFKQSQMLLIGDTDHPVTSIVPNFDRLLAFTAKDTYSVSIDGEKLYSYPVLSDLGSRAKGSAVRIGNDVIVLNERGVCRLHATASDPDSLSVKNLSERLGASWGRELSKSTLLFWDSVRQELWIRDPSETFDGIVWIWNAALDEWYCFDGIHASFFTFCKNKLLFGSQSELCIFENGLRTDGDEIFCAYYQSNYTGFDSPHAVKRALRAAISATVTDSELQLDLETETVRQSFFPKAQNQVAPSLLDVRFSPGRFRFFRYRITCMGERASKIHEANFFTTL